MEGEEGRAGAADRPVIFLSQSLSKALPDDNSSRHDRGGGGGTKNRTTKLCNLQNSVLEPSSKDQFHPPKLWIWVPCSVPPKVWIKVP